MRILRIKLLIALCFLTLPGASLLAQAPLFFDDFEDGNSNGWLARNSSNWYVAQDEGDYSYFHHNTNLVGYSQQLNEWSVYQNQSFSNYIFSAKIKSPEDLSTNSNADYALIFNYQDDDNYYLAFFNSGANETMLIVRLDGVETVLVRVSEPSILDNTYHTVAVKILNGSIKILANEKVIIETTDATFSQGKIGLGVRNDAAYFDNVFVADNPATSCAFWDDFNDNIFDGWTAQNISRWSTKFHEGDYALWINTSSYNSTTEHNLGEIATIDNYVWDNFVLECDIKSYESSSNPGADLAVIFGYQDINNYYYAILNRTSGSTKLRRLQNGISYDLDSFNSSVLADQNWHHVKLTAANGTFSVYYDNQLVLSASDNTFGAGRIGLGSKNDSGFFDDICISTTTASTVKLFFNQLEPAGFPTIDCFVTVSDNSGNPIMGLTENNFQVTENGIVQNPITVTSIGGTPTPISVALIIDRSGSMQGQKLSDAKTAANTFVDEMAANDKGTIISFASDVMVNQSFTTNKGLLHNAINSLSSGGGTNLYDAIVEGVNQCNTQSGRKAIIALTDGNASIFTYTLDQCIAQAVNAGLPVYTIGLGSGAIESDLRKIADETGGQYYYAPTSAELESIYQQISQQIQNQYKISYSSNNPSFDCTTRNVEITVTHAGASDKKSKSYQAPCSPSVPIFPTAPTAYYVAGTDFWIDIQVGTPANPVANLFGVSFILNYNNTQYIDVISPYSSSVLSGPFMGNDVVLFQDVDDASGRISMGVSRKTGSGGVNGYGSVARIHFSCPAGTPNNTLIDFNLIEVSAIDPNGSPISLDPHGFQIQISAGLEVWPGDTNNDGIVDARDVLPLGVHFAVTGPSRAAAPNNTWMAQLCAPPWNPVEATYADCDGNGVINQADIFGIGLNWHKSHTMSVQSQFPYCLAKQNSTAICRSLCPNQDAVSNTQYISIQTENITDLLGIAFELEATTNGQTVVFDSTVYGSFLGGDLIAYDDIDNIKKVVSVGVTRKAKNGGVTGNGEVARIYYHETEDAPFATTVNFELKNVEANDPSGQAIELVIENCSIALSVQLTAFSVTQTQNGILLRWNSAKEYGISGFFVEKQKNRSGEWSTIGYIDCQRKAKKSADYDFLDIDLGQEIASYRLRQINEDGSVDFSEIVEIQLVLPKAIKLEQNYPNPFNPGTTIQFSVPEATHLSIEIYNTLGQKIRTLANAEYTTGIYSLSWDATNNTHSLVSPGIYFCVIKDEKRVIDTIKMIYTK